MKLKVEPGNHISRQVKGSRDVHSVYEALDWLAAALPDGAKGKGKS